MEVSNIILHIFFSPHFLLFFEFYGEVLKMNTVLFRSSVSLLIVYNSWYTHRQICIKITCLHEFEGQSSIVDK